MSPNRNIQVFGASCHNLKSVDCRIPVGKMSVVTGPSGSGKSSLVFDTIWAESQRRYTESLPAYVRQILGVWEKPAVRRIDGLMPSVALDARPAHPNPRSTVATITEIYDYLRLLFAHAGEPHCPVCGKTLQRSPRGKIVAELLAMPEKSKVQLTAPLGVCRGKEFKALWAALLQEGFLRVLVDGAPHYVDAPPPKLSGPRAVEVVVDRLTVKASARQRFAEAVETALARSGGFVAAHCVDGESLQFCEHYVCRPCGVNLPVFSPVDFSFNNPRGACPQCHGLGMVEAAGRGGKGRGKRGKGESQDRVDCMACRGARLRPESLGVRIAGKNMHEVVSLSVREGLDFFEALGSAHGEGAAVKPILDDVVKRMRLLLTLGLHYLTLGRSVPSLSAGEHQRLRLAMQIGADLAGILYVLDEPTVGLHPTEGERLLAVFRRLCDRGNTVLLVEHDPAMVRAADHVLDLGPGAGPDGGHIMAAGTPDEIKAQPASLTGRYLSGTEALAAGRQDASRVGHGVLTVKGARAHNLKGVDVSFMLGALNGVAGVSGSGKSTLVMDTLYLELCRQLQGGQSVPGKHGKIICRPGRGGAEIQRVVAVDQSPIGRTSRSNPATYTGLFAPIRRFFAELPLSRVRGYGASRFSFNAKGGRCEVCHGEGVKRVSMHFLPDILVPCELCQGQRFNAETLDVHYRGLSIADVLALTVTEAHSVFSAIPKVASQLGFLERIGLGYLQLGQRADTLSGGEAQRLKLSRELAHTSRNTLYILDEPTTGLHQHDISLLVSALEALVKAGNTVIVIEHNVDFLGCVDHLVELGPGGGPDGGSVLAAGKPEEVAAQEASLIGPYLNRTP